MRRIVWIILQIILIVSIFSFLFWKAAAAVDSEGKNVFAILYEQPKRWELLIAAFFAQFLAVLSTFFRWRWLVKTLGLSCSYHEMFRLSFLGFAVTLAPLGGIGGDTVRAVMLARNNPRHRSQAVASVIIDRYLGLLVMFLYCSVFIWITGFSARTDIIAKTFTHIVFALTGSSLFFSVMVFLPFFDKGHLERLIEKIPFCGKMLGKLIRSLLIYRRHQWCLIQSCFLTVFTHFFFGLSLYGMATALFSPVPNLTHHIMLHNVANIASMIPLAVGPYELMLEQLYQLVTKSVGMGLVIALAYRMIFISVAAVGILYCIKRD